MSRRWPTLRSIFQRRQALHQRLHRHDHDALAQARQAVQGGQALADDVRVWAELVVGQRLPVGKRHHRDAAALAEQGQQVRFELVRAVGIARHDQQRAVVGLGGAGDVPGQRGGRSGITPVGAELPGAG
jgi:hypothetical protein